MADVTINQLSEGVPNKSSAIIPYSDGSTTYKTSPSGIVAAAPGCIIQVKQTIKSDTFGQSANGVEMLIPGLSAQITPTSASSNVLINVMLSWGCYATTYGGYLKRNGAIFGVGNAGTGQHRVSMGIPFSRDVNQMDTSNLMLLDSPNTTSPVTYEFFVINDNSEILYVNRSNNDITSGALGATGKRGISTITLMEIAG